MRVSLSLCTHMLKDARELYIDMYRYMHMYIDMYRYMHMYIER